MPEPDPLTRTLKTLATVALALALVAVALLIAHKILGVLVVLVGAVLFAYLVYPLVRRLERRMPRWLAIVCVYVLLLVALGGLGAFVGPRIAFEAHGLALDFPRLLAQGQSGILNAHLAIVGAVPLAARESVAKVLDSTAAAIQHSAMSLVGQVLGVLLSVASVLTALVVIPVLTFYILMDLERLRAGFLRLVPAAHRHAALLVLGDIDGVLGGFIRGQIVVGAVIAVLVTVLLLVLRIKYAFLIGLFAGIVDVIPYLGAVAGAVPAVLIAALTHGAGWALLVAAGFVAIYQVEGHVVAPTVVGQRVGLTPLMVIVAILTGAELGGILGMFFAVPVAAIARALVARLVPADGLSTMRDAEPTPSLRRATNPDTSSPPEPSL
jgi:predicted PurR-regulated permease PerM